MYGKQHIIGRNTGRIHSIIVLCPMCNKEFEVQCSEIGFQKWLDGYYIQNALPELSKANREMIISGIDAKCFNKFY